jgi:O-antigen/teichoic acid export membrane protein
VSVLVQTVVFICGALACLFLGFSLVAIGWAAIVAALVQLAVSAVLARRFSTIPVRLRPHWQTMRNAMPYMAGMLAHVAFAQSNVVILSLIASQALVGEFTSVSRILLLASLLPQLVNLAIMPASSRVFGQANLARFRRLTTASLRILLILAGAGAVALVSVSRPLMGWIYGEELEPLYPFLQVGTLYLVFQFTSHALGLALTSADRQGARAKATLIALATAVVLIAILTPLLGVLGAVLALVLSELVFVVAEAVPAWDLLDPRDLLRNAAWVVAAGGLAVSAHFWLAAAGHPWPAAVVPLLLYGVLLVPSGEAGALIEIVRHRR